MANPLARDCFCRAAKCAPKIMRILLDIVIIIEQAEDTIDVTVKCYTRSLTLVKYYRIEIKN